MKKSVLHSLFFLVGLQSIFCQNNSSSNYTWSLKPVINSGIVLIHRSSISHLVKGYPTIYEMNLVKTTPGNKLWHLENNYPDIGISFQCIDYKNPLQLGYAITTAPFIEIPLNSKKKVSRLIMRICFGATYITKKFNVFQNQKDVAIGSHINAFIQFRWFWHIQLTKKLRFEPGITFSHASNGRTKVPNLGLNTLSINMGLNFALPSNKINSYSSIDSSTKVKRKNELLTFAAIGYNQKGVNTAMLKTYVISVAYQRNIRNTHKFAIGADVFYDQNYKLDYESFYLTKAKGLDEIRMAAKIGYSYNIGKISFPIELGYYFVDNFKPDAPIVSRLAVRYYSKCGLVAHFGLRTHYAVAYNFEYGLGYRLFIGKK